MHCLTCNLQYPDHLKFCKHCGRPLSRPETGVAAEGTRCTRCGVRVVLGENFCQQCGARVAATAEETTIGTCNNCGVPWRSVWLFCKNCGMARANALVTLPDLPPPQSSVPTLVTETYQPELEIAASATVLAHCPYCAAEVEPESRFCETCGGKLRAADTGELTVPLGSNGSSAAEVGIPAGEELSSKAGPADHAPLLKQAAPTLLDEPVPAEVAALGSGGWRAEPLPVEPGVAESNGTGLAREVSAGRRETVEVTPVVRTGGLKAQRMPPNSKVTASTASTVVIPISPSPRIQASPGELHLRSYRVVWQGILVLAIAGLLATITGVLVWESLSKEVRDASRARHDSRPASEPTPAIMPQPSPPPSPGASTEPPEGLVYISGGAFEMGRNDGDEFERPAHIVEVRPFFIDRTEVTNQQYREFVQSTGHRPPPHWQGGECPAGEDRLPVVNVSWYDAQAYATWAGKRLPTEEEWEFAARGTDGRLYPWGQDWNPSWANTEEGHEGRLIEVGRYGTGASPFGLLDMCGNVWEWTASDLLSYTEPRKKLAPRKVARGGAYDVPHENATTTYRGALQAEKTYEKTGFRCARDAQP